MQTASDEILIHVSVREQTLELRRRSGEVLGRYPVSTSGYGVGSEPGSLRTPLGRFRVAEKIGEGAPLGAVFKGRVPTGEIGLDATGDDLVLTRILWLAGEEAHNANTYDRYIYIHGTNHEKHVGTPASHGCIRLRNGDMADLFDRVPGGSAVHISEA